MNFSLLSVQCSAEHFRALHGVVCARMNTGTVETCKPTLTKALGLCQYITAFLYLFFQKSFLWNTVQSIGTPMP